MLWPPTKCQLTQTSKHIHACVLCTHITACMLTLVILYDMQVFNPHVDFLKLKYLIIYCKTSGLNFTPPTVVHVYKL